MSLRRYVGYDGCASWLTNRMQATLNSAPDLRRSASEEQSGSDQSGVMTHAMTNRMDIAQRVARAFQDLPGVLGASACGSVGLGLADEEADVDLAFVVTSAIPAPEQRRRIYMGLSDPDREFDVDALGPNTFDCFHMDGVQVEPQFHILDDLKRRIALALKGTSCERKEPAGFFGRFPDAVLSDIHYWRILFECDNVLSDLKRRVAYPDSLRRAILRQGRFWSDPHILYEHERACVRGDSVYALRCQSKIAEHFIQVVFALNQTYCPGHKWALHFMDEFEQVPIDFPGRFRAFVAGANDARGLVRKNELAHHLFRDLREMVTTELEKEA